MVMAVICSVVVYFYLSEFGGKYCPCYVYFCPPLSVETGGPLPQPVKEGYLRGN